MSTKNSEQHTVADTPSTTTASTTDRHGAAGGGMREADSVAQTPGQAQARMIFHRSTSSSQGAQQPPNGHQAEGTGAGATQSAKQSQLLQIPDHAPPQRLVENSIWDWDAPLDNVDESPTYYYEPQGELLQEHRDQRPTRPDFSIPHAIGDARLDWQTLGIPLDPNGSNGFAVPKRPSGVPHPTAGVKRKSSTDREPSSTGRQPEPKRLSRAVSDTMEDEPDTPSDGRAPAQSTRSHSGPGTRVRSGTATGENRPRSAVTDTEGARPGPGIGGGHARTMTDPSTPVVLPARKVFPIQIGDKLFRLSGASISSDAPSYFSQFFEEQLRQNEGADSVRTLYIDRDPATFEDISLHLQGYHIEPKDGPHFVKLFADAQFFSLPRLTAQLFSSTIYIRIGNSEFQIPRDLFSNPGDSPNYFSLGFAIFFTTPTEVFPGLSQRTLLRPPSILPPSVPNRSARTFADLLHILKGYPVEIRSEEHRIELLRDARYFHLKGLEQRLIPHQIAYNLARKTSEIMVRLEDIRQSGVSYVADGGGLSSTGVSPASSAASSTPAGPGWVYYQRPYVDPEAYSLIIEIGGDESTFLSIAPGPASSPARVGRATFHRQALSRITSLLSVIANKMNLPITQPLGLMMMERGAGVASLPVSPGNTGMSEERVKVRIGVDADVTVDGVKWVVGEDEDDDDEEEEDMIEVDHAEASRYQRKRKRGGEEEVEAGEDWVVKKAQWRLRVQPVQTGRTGMEVILGAVKIEAFGSERARNATRAFLV
ncbi:hypothetical protein LTR36_003372 [Oleoguttula mirabilis]|uniref:BTB/POZ domain-containing protein n=1 Tax=Oleoguttula mirabilis TaxID=1507867 RepID=A0AAV9JJ59_9PEZI|nr:hypothetical protein LTR36_003372 [Oleoguttula mirabilis]